MLEDLLTNNFKKTEALEFLKVIMKKYPFLEEYFYLSNNSKDKYLEKVKVFVDKDEDRSRSYIKFVFDVNNEDEQGIFIISFRKQKENSMMQALDLIRKNNNKKYKLANFYKIYSSYDRSYSMSHKTYAYYNTENQTLIDEKSLYFDSNNRLIDYVDKSYDMPSYQSLKYKKLRKI